ncbi:tRNA (N6-threonylcarbamoyladenosine(37)-N6)-methyltransferase TrmO [Mangrovactinospora gilvigrisea]|uniref:tRNA (N6-threonylcarbamoyladenosine(37)-N6)-methyltransferase TrmO n=1 Tax=Mangrovactinospora gilvigrisea TaxID=1428644 RepID=A0A1J7CIG4_9ACTN|nr:tRNA (N6-threonylcarbamoyladenosine(37)-N6)-methyltransferase TrmO [Mangrovactinospora gilvigrisea]OIV39426.1 tRNA (N6-threonylcarbamoyladenosine(37)-N6)-methyltransferase TrmO [Mangrovactinospora gilvigrisea]
MPAYSPDPNDLALKPVGTVVSELTDLKDAPRQGDEGAPEAWLVFDETVRPALQGLTEGSDVLVLTWLDRSDRSVTAVHPRGDTSRPRAGVFSTRSPDRPNPIGLHQVTITSIEELRIRVRNLEALDGTPVLDLKPLLGPTDER